MAKICHLTGNRRAAQRLPDHTTAVSTMGYLGVDINDEPSLPVGINP